MELRVENQRRFELLSSDLAEISRASKSRSMDGQRVFSQWIGGIDLSQFETESFDERLAFDVAGYLMRRLNVFGRSLPIPAFKLETHYREAQDGGDDYWRFALNAQKERLSGVVKGVPDLPALEKQLRNVRRGIERAIAVLEIDVDKDRSIALFRARVQTYVRRINRASGPKGEIDKVIDEFLRETQDKIDKSYDKILNLEEEEIRLENNISIRKLVDAMMTATRAALLKVCRENQVPTRQAPPTQRPEPTAPDQDPSRKRKAFIPEVVKSDKGKENGKKEFDNLQITKDKFIRAIELALQSGNKLRILIPPEGRLRARFEPQWRDVLEKMGFSGSIEFVVYEDLKRTTDTSTPIMTFKGMNTHGNLWNRGRFENVVVIDLAPLLIINQLP